MSFKTNLINIVLVETSHPGNIGSVARAMKNMGLKNLSLVKPKNFPSGEANALAGNAKDILENTLCFDSIKDAIADSTFVYATSSRNRAIQWPHLNAEKSAIQIIHQTNTDKKVSLIFGREDRGLSNDELNIANYHLEIPASPEYPVLNLAMSVQVVCYEIFKASNIETSMKPKEEGRLNSKNLQLLIEHFIDVSVKAGVIDEDNPKQIIARIKRMFSRMHPDEMEGSFLRGFLSKIEKQIKK